MKKYEISTTCTKNEKNNIKLKKNPIALKIRGLFQSAFKFI